MKHILIINGHQSYRSSEGRLNQTLMDHMIARLEKDYQVKTTTIQQGYDVAEEQQKFLWADLIIYQTPVYWFSVPGLFKTYMDEVYAYGLLFKGSEDYGRGGLLTSKAYMFSTTWNAPQSAFRGPAPFFEGDGLEDALRHLHRAQQFLGLRALPSFACYNVVKSPAIADFTGALDAHLTQVLHEAAIS